MNCVDLMIAASAASFGWLAGKMFWEIVCSNREDYSFSRPIFYYLFKALTFVFMVFAFSSTCVKL